MENPKHGKTLKTVLLIIAGMLLAVILINQITVYPFIWSFRAIMSMTGQQGTVGNYTDAIDSVKEVSQVIVPVDGYPDASFTVYRPKGNHEKLPVIIYIHGGGWSMGNADAVAWFAKLIASKGYVVCNADYALAPENPYPASTIQLTEVVQFVYDHAEDFGINRNAIFIGGNSAGAHLSSQLGALFTDREHADRLGIDVRIPCDAIKGLLLFNGVYNFETAGDCGFFAFGKWMWAYTGRKDYRAYEQLDEMSTVRHITPNYPAVFITVGDADPLEPQTGEFTDVLSENGVDHTALYWTGTGAKLDHDYIYEMNTTEAQKAFETMLIFLSEHAG